MGCIFANPSLDRQRPRPNIAKNPALSSPRGGRFKLRPASPERSSLIAPARAAAGRVSAGRANSRSRSILTVLQSEPVATAEPEPTKSTDPHRPELLDSPYPCLTTADPYGRAAGGVERILPDRASEPRPAGLLTRVCGARARPSRQRPSCSSQFCKLNNLYVLQTTNKQKLYQSELQVGTERRTVMSFLRKVNDFLGGDQGLRPLDYMVLMVILMLTFVRFWN